jgi:RND family efflux transporter MFP subunit
MADRPLHELLRHLRRAAAASGGTGLTDAELLGRFADRRDDAAFEALVWRHGPLVLGVCRRILGHAQDAEDAFQAAFLALARKADAVRRRGAVGPWLYRVAYRAALRARGRAAVPAAPLPDDLPARPAPDEVGRRDLRRVLEEEVRRLPARYREPAVLRYLEGRSTAEAAVALGCPPSTVLSRLAWARRRLRDRLRARGVGLPAAVAAAAVMGAEAGAVPARWVAATVAAAVPFAAAPGLGPTRPAALAEGVLRAMFLTKLRVGAVLVLGVFATGAGLMLPARSAGKLDEPVPAARKPDGPAPAEPPEVTVSQPVKREVAEFGDYTGRIEAAATVEVRPRVSGLVEKVAFRPGAEVKKGDLLFELDPRTYQVEVDKAQAEVLRAEARLRRADADLVRARQLHATHAVGQDMLDRLAGERDEAQAGLLAARPGLERAKLDLGATKVTAPISGWAGRALLDAGNLAGPTTPLVTIVATDPVYAAFDLDERTFLHLRKLTPEGGLGVTALLGLTGEDGFPHRGRVESVDNRVNPATGTVRVRAVFPDAGREVVPGLFARVRLVTGPPREALLVPEQAVGAEDGRQFVLVVNGAGTVERRAVTVGQVDGGLRVIKEGLRADDRVIVSGPGAVKPGMTVRPRPAAPERR